MSIGEYSHHELERRRWQNPEAILASIELESGFTFIDVGCGTGFFALPAAKIVGSKGKVYGIDIDADAIQRLKERALKEGLKNLNLWVGEAEESILCCACADIVFFGIVLHDFRDPVKVLMNAKEMLKPTGRLIDLDWKRESMHLGPPLKIRFSKEKAARLIEQAGFKTEAIKKSGSYHYLIVAKPF